jgi:hypothetical protein
MHTEIQMGIYTEESKKARKKEKSIYQYTRKVSQVSTLIKNQTTTE